MTVSLERTTVTLNGHTIQGWSEDADALTMPGDHELVTTRRGADGMLAGFGTGARGGEISIKLLPIGPSTRFFMQQVTAILGGQRVVWEGSISNEETGAGFTLTRGVMTKVPLGQTMGSGDFANQVFVFEFEEIVPSYDGASFDQAQGAA